MVATEKRQGLIWLTGFAAAGLALLVGLGTWQMRRLAWKEDLLARIAAAAESEPVPVQVIAAQVAARVVGGAARDNLEFRRVRVSGRFDHGKEIHVWAPGKRGPAWSVVTPLDIVAPAGAPAEGATDFDRVLIIRGVVLDSAKAQSTRADGNPSGIVDIVGRVRFGHAGAFANAPDVARNQWYALDGDAIRRAVGSKAAGSPSTSGIVPFFVEAESASGGAGAPAPELGALNISNRHLEYALTWYGLALTLAGVYAAFVVARFRRK
ncbi:MAG: hypothetical protein KDJ37_10900 [Hyphomicrobiaceae bacterium]|nr:hypothetical protein [Hyphomicrobiaceae bacterium]